MQPSVGADVGWRPKVLGRLPRTPCDFNVDDRVKIMDSTGTVMKVMKAPPRVVIGVLNLDSQESRERGSRRGGQALRLSSAAAKLRRGTSSSQRTPKPCDFKLGQQFTYTGGSHEKDATKLKPGTVGALARTTGSRFRLKIPGRRGMVRIAGRWLKPLDAA
jgi:hypothetical protein